MSDPAHSCAGPAAHAAGAGNAGRPVVIVLASGRGERFAASGGGTHKLAALLAGRPVLAHTLDAVRASGLPLHLEDAPHPGMGDSIAAAVRAQRHAPGWLILPGDLPLVQPRTLQRLADALARADVALPRFEGRRGHPVAFSGRCGAALMALSGDTGARAVVAAHDALLVDVDDAGCVTDIDTVDALAQAEALLAQRARAADAGRPATPRGA